ncbi:hypothetical protein [Saccharothrix syringae]|nr:hypothetical protein [Saccharothrix syringae]
MAEVVRRYRAVGRAFELAQAAEDHAVLLARAGWADQAATALREATDLHLRLGAHWDVRRAAARAGRVAG